MAATLDLEGGKHRSQRHWTIDGLPELMMGLLWVLWGGAWLFGHSLPRGPVFNMYWAFTPALLALSGVAAVWATKKLKAHITFPRTGYIEWHSPTRTQRLTAAAVAVGSASLLVVLISNSRTEQVEQLAAPAIAVILSLAFVVAAISQKAPHLLALAGVALILALVFGAVATGWNAVNWLLIGMGATTALLGVVRLGLFIRSHPVVQPDERSNRVIH